MTGWLLRLRVSVWHDLEGWAERHPTSALTALMEHDMEHDR